MVKGICALYGNETDLMESHIFPKFVIKHTKKTGSKFLRKLVEPNKREQDGIKHHLLSFKAEQDFAVREKWFAENIFEPYLQGYTELDYNENLYYFSVSFLWRILLSEFKTTANLKNQWYFKLLQEVEEEWKLYLRIGTIPRKFHNVNLFLTDRIESHTTDLKGVDFYFTRALDGTIVTGPNQEHLILYGKFNRFIFWSVIKSPKYLDELYDVEIHPKGGNIEIPQPLEYEPIINFMTNRIKKISEFALPNETQQDRIAQEIMKDPESFWKSDVGQSLYNDRFNLEK
ncbi:hypothetical protein [Ulvibacterium sp.]|uniref:hypothetical protein n=1 Tax=Ulvibacterium sp. TaxID=2665914 RepID=UPI003BAB6C99